MHYARRLAATLAIVVFAAIPVIGITAPVAAAHTGVVSLDCSKFSFTASGFPAGVTLVTVDVTNHVIPYPGADILVASVQSYVLSVSGGSPSSIVTESIAPIGTAAREVNATWVADNQFGDAFADHIEICSVPATPPPPPPVVITKEVPGPTVIKEVPGPTVIKEVIKQVQVPGKTVTKVVKLIKYKHDRASFTCARGDRKVVVYKTKTHHWYGVCYHQVKVGKKVAG